MRDDLLTRVQAEADLCRNDGAEDIARLLDEVAVALTAPPVVFGIDWGYEGDRAACCIVKLHANGTREVVAQSLGPQIPPSGQPHKTQGGWGVIAANDSNDDQVSGSDPTATRGEGRVTPTLHFLSGGSKDFLEDLSGDRRFWPVEVTGDSSGLTAEGNETGTTSITVREQRDGATTPEPGGGKNP